MSGEIGEIGCQLRVDGKPCGKPEHRKLPMLDPILNRRIVLRLCRACYPKVKTLAIAKKRANSMQEGA
jgi:hypothetical protein